MSKSHNSSPAIEKGERWMDGWMDENNVSTLVIIFILSTKNHQEWAGTPGFRPDRTEVPFPHRPGPALLDFDLIETRSRLPADRARRGGWGRERSVTAGCSFIGWPQKWENRVGACLWVARHPGHTSSKQIKQQQSHPKSSSTPSHIGDYLSFHTRKKSFHIWCVAKFG